MTTPKKSPLNNLFERQQPKVNAKPDMGKLLTCLAEEDHKRIAQLIQKWLNESEANQTGKPRK
ncbi:hypothetical protein [Neptunicella sp.]|uniref:hypothetical protein n=1 Tax=Neptunicella sp. TaxID=2125986 RepID=UPI003F691A21